MKKSLSKQEIIEKLQSLSDLPVVIERDTDVLRSTSITKIEIVNAYKYETEYYVEYNDYGNSNLEEVIWIS